MACFIRMVLVASMVALADLGRVSVEGIESAAKMATETAASAKEEDVQQAAEGTVLESFRDELTRISKGTLREHCVELGVQDHDLKSADDADDTKAAFIELIMAEANSGKFTVQPKSQALLEQKAAAQVAANSSLWCNSWCVTCKDDISMAKAHKDGELPVDAKKKIYVSRNSGSRGKFLEIGLFFATFGVSAIVSSLNTMVNGCSNVQFVFAGNPKEKVNYPFLLARGNQDAAQQGFAKKCAKISEKRNNWRMNDKDSNKEASMVGVGTPFDEEMKQCFNHEWLCGASGVADIETMRIAAETRCITYKASEWF